MTPLILLASLIQFPGAITDRHVVVAPDETVHVSISGEGRPIVIVPGLLGAGFGFRKLVPLLHEEGFRTHVLDLLGTGESGYPRGADYSLEAQAGRVEAVMDSLDLGASILVAHAIGGSVGLRLAARRPDLVSGIVLIEAGPAESAASPGLRRAMKLRALIRILGSGRLRGRIRDQMIAASGDPAWVDPAAVAGYTAGAERDLGATLRALDAMANAHEACSLADALPSIEAPILLLLGGIAHAGKPPEAEIELLARRVPSFSQETLEGVGHFPHEENPALVRDAIVRASRAVLVLAPGTTG